MRLASFITLFLLLFGCADGSDAAGNVSVISDRPMSGMLDGQEWTPHHMALDATGWKIRSEPCRTEMCFNDSPEITLDWDILADTPEGNLSISRSAILSGTEGDKNGFITKGVYVVRENSDGTIDFGLRLAIDDKNFVDGFIRLSSESPVSSGALEAITDQQMQGRLNGNAWQAHHMARGQNDWVVRSEACPDEACEIDSLRLELFGSVWDEALEGPFEGTFEDHHTWVTVKDADFMPKATIRKGFFASRQLENGDIQLGLQFEDESGSYAVNGWVTVMPKAPTVSQ